MGFGGAFEAGRGFGSPGDARWVMGLRCGYWQKEQDGEGGARKAAGHRWSPEAQHILVIPEGHTAP